MGEIGAESGQPSVKNAEGPVRREVPRGQPGGELRDNGWGQENRRALEVAVAKTRAIDAKKEQQVRTAIAGNSESYFSTNGNLPRGKQLGEIQPTSRVNQTHEKHVQQKEQATDSDSHNILGNFIGFFIDGFRNRNNW